MKIIAGAAFFSYGGQEFRIFFVDSIIYTKFLSVVDVPFSKLNCWNEGPESYNQVIIVKEISHFANSILMAFCYASNQVDKYVGIRNL